MKTWIEISASALLENVRRIRAHVAPSNVMAVVKSDAYGHGLVQVAPLIQNEVDAFAVDRVEEGMTLRSIGIEKRILVLGYIEDAVQRRRAIAEHLEIAVSSFEQLEQLHFTTQEMGETAPADVDIHLEVETGLYRLGIPEEDIIRCAELLRSQSNIRVRGIFTHFANVEEELHEGFPSTQRETFLRLRRSFEDQGIVPTERHMACSAAGIGFEGSRMDYIRLGISLYGLWSSELVRIRAGSELSLTPVLTWKTVVAQVKHVPSGSTVGYARSHTVTRDSRIAVLPIGYYDGYPRSLSSVGVVLVHGVRCKVIGKICMNMCMVDVTDVPLPVVPGTEVILIGNGVPAEEVALLGETIHYELVTRLCSKIPRLVVD